MDAEQLESLASSLLARVKAQQKNFATIVSNLQNELLALRETQRQEMREGAPPRRPPTRSAQPEALARITRPAVGPQTTRHWVVAARIELLLTLFSGRGILGDKEGLWEPPREELLEFLPSTSTPRGLLPELY